MFCCMQNLQLDFRVYGTFQYRERAFSDVGEEGRRWRPCYCTKLGFGNAKIFSFKAKTAANKHATPGSSDKVTVLASPRAKKKPSSTEKGYLIAVVTLRTSL